MRAFMLAALAAAIAFTGCNKKQLRPGFCDMATNCGDGLMCDARDGGSWKCVEAGVMDAPTEATDGGDGGEAGDARDGGDGGDGGDARDGAVDVRFHCTTSTECRDHDGGTGKVCEPDAGDCVECLPTNASACTGTAKPVCLGIACVQCLPNMADACTGTTPICVGTTCVPCSKDSDCTGPGICIPTATAPRRARLSTSSSSKLAARQAMEVWRPRTALRLKVSARWRPTRRRR